VSVVACRGDLSPRIEKRERPADEITEGSTKKMRALSLKIKRFNVYHRFDAKSMMFLIVIVRIDPKARI
jgi:hypothetical protein